MSAQGGAIRTTKLAPGRYHTSFARSGPRGGRPPGTEQPVPPELQESGLSYCACGRRLNANNQSGVCRTCAPHGRIRPADPCFEPTGHRWRTVPLFPEYRKRCIHCGVERPFTTREIAAQRRAR